MFDHSRMQQNVANDSNPFAKPQPHERAFNQCENAFDAGKTHHCICGQHQMKHYKDANGTNQLYLA